MSKSDKELLGVQFDVPRNGKDPVDVNLYLPEEGDNLPVVFNLHGGAFIGGDADTLDTQSDRISRKWNVIVVTINYRLAKDGITIGDGTQEVVDVIRYFKHNAKQYGADPNSFCVMGYSEGGCHAIAAVIELKAQNIDIATQVLCYPYLGSALENYNKLSQEQQASIAPALFVLADNDPISNGSLSYRDALEENGVHTEVKQYGGAIHGFIEENNPEYDKLNNKPSKEKDQTLIVYIHGGGFTSRDKSDGERLCKYFTSKGYICASVNYTLKDGAHESNFNKMYEQILEQVSSIKEKAADIGYHITEMATSGDSAGGYLAMLYAYRDAEVSPIPVKLVFQMTGPATFEPEVWGDTTEENMLLSASVGSGKVVTHDMIASGEFEAIIKEISPALLVNEQTVPTVMAYGPKDKVVPVQLKYSLIDALEKYGVDYTYIEFPNSGHGMLFDPDKMQQYVDIIHYHLKKYMDNH